MGHLGRLGIITGLKLEANIIDRLHDTLGASAPELASAGGIPERADELARNMAANGVAGLVSFGLAGGLDPALKPGTLAVPTGVIGFGSEFVCDDRWTKMCKSTLDPHIVVTGGVLITVDTVIADQSAKRQLFQKSGAVAVDMESAGVARAAREAGLPFITLRAISDTAKQRIPTAAMGAMSQDGSIDMTKIARAALTRPHEIGDLLRLGRQTSAAKRTLARVAQSGLPFFGLV